MKKIISILLIAVISIMTINVHAEGEGWPKEITYGGFTFTITGIALDFYEINKADEIIEKGTEFETDTYTTAKTTESLINYMEYLYNDYAWIPEDRFTLTPSLSQEKISSVDTLFGKLNLNITDDYIKEEYNNLVENGYLDPVDENKSYIVDVDIAYRIDNYPEEYKIIIEKDMLRETIRMVDLDLMDGYHSLYQGYENYFMIDKKFITLNSTTNEAEVGFNNNVLGSFNELLGDNPTNSLDLLRSDFLLFYKDENAKITDTPDYTISFTNLADTTNLLNLLKGADDSVSNNPITDIQDEIVKIPDTAKNVPYILYIFGIGVFLAGAVIIAKVLRQPKKGV